jgi:hypothetical protein
MSNPQPSPDYGRRQPPSSNLPVALAYIEKHPERKLFPCIGDKSRPAFKKNLALASNDPSQLKAWDAEHSRRGRIMWACSPKVSGIICIDADLQKPGAKETLDQLVNAVRDADFAEILSTETATTPSGGLHLIFKGEHKFHATDDPEDFAKGRTGKYIDVPNYFMIPGQARADGKRYALVKDIPAMKAPPSLQLRVKPPKPERKRTYSAEAVPLDLFKKMLAATPYTGGPAGLDDRHSYGGCVNFMMAAHEAACGDEADYLEAVIDWCFADPNQDWKEPTSREWVERRWCSFNSEAPNAITRASWFKTLQSFGRDDLVAKVATAEDVQSFRDDPADFTPPANDNDAEAIMPDTPQRPFPEPVSAAQLIDGAWPRPEFLVEGLIMKGYPNTTNADGGTGKTTVHTQMGVSIAAGAPIFGRATIQAPVLLVLCEDDNGITQERVIAQAKQLGIDPRTLPLTTWALRGYDVPLAKISDQGVIKHLPFFKKLDERMASMPGCYVVLDSLIDVVQMEMKDPAPANAFFKRLLTDLCQRHDATISVLAHPSKASMADGSWSHGTLAFKNAVRQSLAMRMVEGQEYRELWSLKHNYTDENRLKLWFEYPLFTISPPSASDNPTVVRDAAILEYVVQQVREGKARVVRTNQGGGQTPRMIADALNDGGGLSGGTVTWQQVQSVMVRAERNGVLKYVEGYGKTAAHYEWRGDAEPSDDAADDFAE